MSLRFWIDDLTPLKKGVSVEKRVLYVGLGKAQPQHIPHVFLWLTFFQGSHDFRFAIAGDLSWQRGASGTAPIRLIR